MRFHFKKKANMKRRSLYYKMNHAILWFALVRFTHMFFFSTCLLRIFFFFLHKTCFCRFTQSNVVIFTQDVYNKNIEIMLCVLHVHFSLRTITILYSIQLQFQIACIQSYIILSIFMFILSFFLYLTHSLFL